MREENAARQRKPQMYAEASLLLLPSCSSDLSCSSSALCNTSLSLLRMDAVHRDTCMHVNAWKLACGR